MSYTPRTDALQFCHPDGRLYAAKDLASTLERELAASQAEVARLRKSDQILRRLVALAERIHDFGCQASEDAWQPTLNELWGHDHQKDRAALVGKEETKP